MVFGKMTDSIPLKLAWSAERRKYITLIKHIHHKKRMNISRQTSKEREYWVPKDVKSVPLIQTRGLLSGTLCLWTRPRDRIECMVTDDTEH